MKNINKFYLGQALVSLIIFSAISMIIISAMITIIASNSLFSSINQQSLLVKQAAENGIENALINLLRNPSYLGETMDATVNNFPTVITITGSDNNKTIVSTASTINFKWKIVAKIDYTDNIMKLIFWQDSYE